MEILRTFDLLFNLEENFKKDDIFARRVSGKWIKYSIEDYHNNSHNIAYGLLSMGYSAGTKVISLCNNCPQWNFIDIGVNLAHMVHVPIYSTLSKDDYSYIFNHSDAEVIFVGNERLYKRIIEAVEATPRQIKVILIDKSDSAMYCLSDLYEEGKQNADKFRAIVEDNIKNISPDELCSIIYTSGTTGKPKGVMLSHRNLTSNSHGHAVRQTKNSSHKMVSFLPLCHAYERTMNYEYQELGISTYYAESLSTVASDLKDCHADGFCAVPRVIEMMYGKFEAAGKKLKGAPKLIYSLAWNYANNFDNYNKSKCYLTKQKIYDKLVYSKWREQLGGHEMLVVSGGSSIQAKIVRCFNAAKLYIYEGYGMTETSPVIAVNSPADGYNIIGTCGKAMGGTELRIAQDGEILTRGPHVMLGYYKAPEQTAEIIDNEGWLHTGDIGTLVDGQYLKITDRKKEIFKLSAGKYVAPQVIEKLMKESSDYISDCIVVGENKKFASAIIIPNFQALKEWAKIRKINYTSDAEMIANSEVIDWIHKEIEKINKSLSPYEQIKRERLICDNWSVDNNMLSQTLKLKRKNIHKKYESLINEIYSE